MGKIIGIDLGTSNSVMAILVDGIPTIIPNSEGNHLTPSVVTFIPDGTWVVGDRAKSLASQYPNNSIFAIKRLIGRKYQDPTVQKDIPLLPYTIISSGNGDAWVKIEGTDYSPPEISAIILQKLKWDAERYLEESISQVVITVPAYFSYTQRQATKEACKIAGLELLRMINEPTAAALAYGLNRKKDERALVFSFGGGSLDITLLELGDGVFDVKAVIGDTDLGGKDLDNCIIRELISNFQLKEGIDLSHNDAALQRLRESSEQAKIDLSNSLTTEINIPYIFIDKTGTKHLHMVLTRDRLVELIQTTLEGIKKPLDRILNYAYLEDGWASINDVVLVGGQTRMPAIQNYLKEITGKELQKNINPDEVVALGASIQAGILTGDIHDLMLIDVIPHSLGIETLGGVTTKLVERNTTIPTQKSHVFSTTTDNQVSVEIHILQGEREMAKDNASIGRFILDGIPPAPRGIPQVEVTFDIDANGIVNVEARDKGTSREQHITIQSSSGLSSFALENLIREAAERESSHQASYKVKLIREAARDEAYNVTRSIRELSPFVESEQHEIIEKHVADVYAALETEDISRIETARKILQETLFEIGSKIYRNLYGNKPIISTQQGESVTYHIFISHNHVDNVFSRELVRILRETGADIWYDESELQYGELTPKIERQLIERQILIPIITPASLRSRWVNFETKYFYELYLRDSNRVILPVIAHSISRDSIWPYLRDFKRIEGAHSLPVTPSEAALQIIQILASLQSIKAKDIE